MQKIKDIFEAHENIMDAYKALTLNDMLTLAEHEVNTDGIISEVTLDFLIHTLKNAPNTNIINIHPLVLKDIIELIP